MAAGFTNKSTAIGSFVDGSGSILAGLRTHLNAKKNRLNSVYSCGAFHKKPKKFVTDINVINSSVGPLSLKDVTGTDEKSAVSWSSEMDSEASSISGLLDVENMKNMVTKETSYVNFDNSVVDENIDDTMLQKTCT
ncbi:hypothetical protein G9A89_002379 [Geosiphon pyriformis]|nr:hypothetical protein G9A89_002379 [Geosiphon pyriformis]